MDADRSSTPQTPLVATNVNRRLGHYARGFIEFREKYDSKWELAEAALTAIVFVLFFLGYEAQEHAVGLISHILVGILLVLKFLSLAVASRAKHHSPGQDLE